MNYEKLWNNLKSRVELEKNNAYAKGFNNEYEHILYFEEIMLDLEKQQTEATIKKINLNLIKHYGKRFLCSVQKIREIYENGNFTDVQRELSVAMNTYNIILDLAEIERRFYMDAHQEILDELEENPEHIKTFWGDFEKCIELIEYNLEVYKGSETKQIHKSIAWSNIMTPIVLLNVLWIYKDENYNGDLYMYSETENFKSLTRYLEDKGE